MKKRISYLLGVSTLLLVSCKTAQVEKVIPVVKTEIVENSTDRLKKRITYLASDELKGRNVNTKGIHKAADFIISELKKSGVQSFRGKFKYKINITDYNLVGFIEGTDSNLKNEYVMVGAHYDHIGMLDNSNAEDVIYNGANDNASGVGAVLASADYFAKNPPKRSVIFALFTAEEIGLKGSWKFAEQMKELQVNVVSMFNIEMIGVPMKKNPNQVYLTGFHKTNMAEVVNTEMKEDFLIYLPKAKTYGLFQRSDNYPFYKVLNIPAQTISSFDFGNYNYYHHTDDEVEKLDFNAMNILTQKAIQVIAILGNTEKSIQFR